MYVYVGNFFPSSMTFNAKETRDQIEWQRNIYQHSKYMFPGYSISTLASLGGTKHQNIWNVYVLT